MVLEWNGGCWNGLEWCWSGAKVERLGIVLEGVRGVGVVLEQPGRCWSVLEWCWGGLEDVGVA